MQQGKKYFFLKNSFILLSLLLLLLSGCGSAPKVVKKPKPTPTPTPIPDNGERFYLSTDTSVQQYRTFDGHQFWSWSNSSKSDSSQVNSTDSGTSDLTISNGMAYMNVPLSGNYHISAFNVKTGKMAWQTPFDDLTNFVTDGRGLYVGSGTNVFGLNPSTGQASWELPIAGNSNIIFMTLHGSTLYVTNKYSIFAIDVTTHHQLWTYNMTQINVYDEINKLLVDGNTLVVVTAQSFSGFNMNTGKFLWLADMTVSGYTDDIQTHTIHALTSSFRDTPNNGKTGLLNIQTNNRGGTVNWIAQFSVSANAVEQIRFTTDTVFIAQNNGTVSQILSRRLKDGQLEWEADAAPPVNGVRTTTSSETLAELRVSSSEAYAVMNDGFVYAFNITNGKFLWGKGLLAIDVVPVDSTQPTQAELFAFGSLSTNAANQSSTANHGYVAKLNPQTGKLIWQSSANINVFFPIQATPPYSPVIFGTVTPPLPVPVTPTPVSSATASSTPGSSTPTPASLTPTPAP